MRGNPFLEMDSAGYDDMVTDAVVTLLRERGVDSLSLGTIARWIGVTPSAMIHKAGSKAKVLEIACSTFARRWVSWWSWPSLDDPCPVRFPESEVELHGARVWHALSELAAGWARAGDDPGGQSAVRGRRRALLHASRAA